MHPSNWSRNRVSLSIRSFRSALHPAESFFQSSAVGVRSPGSDFKAFRIASSGIPVFCATLIKATRRNTSLAYRRWFPAFRQLLISPFVS